MSNPISCPRRAPLWLPCLLITLALAVGCDDDDGVNNLVANDTSVDIREDADRDDTRDVTPRDERIKIPDMTARDTSMVDTAPPDFEEEVIEPPVDDLACSVEDRIAACTAALLNDGAMMPSDPADTLYYVNRWYEIPSDYPISPTSTWLPCDGGDPGVMHDLICVPLEFSTRDNALRQLAWETDAPADLSTTFDGLPVGYEGKVGYKAMFEAARAEAGYDLFVASGFRSFATQQATFNAHMNREISNGLSPTEAELEASTYSAQPGHSEHQLGTTADLTFRRPDGSIFPGLDQTMANYEAMRWVHANSHRFGIVLTYDRDKVATTQYVYEPWHHRFVGVEAADAMRECMLNTEEFLAERYGVGALPEYAAEDRILYHDATLRAHPTLPPGGWVEPGASFTKTWRVRNSGSINWHDYTLGQVAGENVFGASDLTVSCIRVGDVVDFSMELTAPATEGRYTATFQLMTSDGTPFGDDLVLDVIVDDEPPPEPTTYRFVRIDDLSNASGGADPGADLDAVVVTKPGGQRHYADSVQLYTAQPSDVQRNDPAAILGAPDAFMDYPDTTTCNVDAGFVSLGGQGRIVVHMGADIEANDTLEVLELGGCSYGGGTAIADEVRVQIAIADDLDTQWVTLGQGTGPAITFNVPMLP